MKDKKTQPKPPFNLEDIEDVRIIIKAKGKHHSIVAKNGRRDQALVARIAILRILFVEHDIVIESLEELSQKKDETGRSSAETKLN